MIVARQMKVLTVAFRGGWNPDTSWAALHRTPSPSSSQASPLAHTSALPTLIPPELVGPSRDIQWKQPSDACLSSSPPNGRE